MKFIKLITVAFLIGIITGCAVKGGNFSTETHFSFPNSNVVPLGQVKSSMSKWSFLFPDVSGNETLELMKEAIAQQPGADMLINYVLDTENTMFLPFVYKIDMVLEGTAAKMQIGEQDLRSVIEQVEYRSFKNSQ
jgi:hypothetical protein